MRQLIPADDDWHPLDGWPVSKIELPRQAGLIDIDAEGVGWVRLFANSRMRFLPVTYTVAKTSKG